MSQMENNELKLVKELEKRSSQELSEVYQKDIKAFFGNYQVDNMREPFHLVVYVLDEEKAYYDNEAIVFLDNASDIDEVKSFKNMYDIFELEKARETLKSLENKSYNIYVKALLANELGVNNLVELEKIYRDYIEDDNYTLLNYYFYDKVAELNLLENKSRAWVDLDNDGIEDRVDYNPNDARVSTAHEQEKIDKKKRDDIEL